jgi:uncharacterized membrane protein YfcA
MKYLKLLSTILVLVISILSVEIGLETDAHWLKVIFGIFGVYFIYRMVGGVLTTLKNTFENLRQNFSIKSFRIEAIRVAICAAIVIFMLDYAVKCAQWFVEGFKPFCSNSVLLTSN